MSVDELQDGRRCAALYLKPSVQLLTLLEHCEGDCKEVEQGKEGVGGDVEGQNGILGVGVHDVNEA